ncbi:MAG: hypothetical protein PHY47_17595 [Lachnospiraceae bacterium]|nr:hypothetical protein [Lachnospiraceae bacterium]
MKEYITSTEQAQCLEVKEIFDTFLQEVGDSCIVDAYPFGFLVMEWFHEEYGFSSQKIFLNASDLFDYMLSYWETYQAHKIIRVEEQDNEQMLSKAIDTIRYTMQDERNELIMQYENAAMLWDVQN